MIIVLFVLNYYTCPYAGWLGYRRTDWFVLTPPDGAWSRIRATGHVYPNPITTWGYLYSSNISFEDWWTQVIVIGVGWWVQKSAKIDLRNTHLHSCVNGLACLANHNCCVTGLVCLAKLLIVPERHGLACLVNRDCCVNGLTCLVKRDCCVNGLTCLVNRDCCVNGLACLANHDRYRQMD